MTAKKEIKLHAIALKNEQKICNYRVKAGYRGGICHQTKDYIFKP
ncbi:hypothetical protein [Desulfosarcina ovata]|nr:hypothetical protein [Desulfosarcina ovata]